MTTTPLRRQERTSWQADATITARDQQRLLRLMGQETSLYNTLNEALRAKLRSDPGLLARMPERQVQALLTAIEVGFNIREVRTRSYDQAVLPPSLEQFRDLLFNRGLDTMERPRHESLLGLFEIAAHPAQIHGEMRRHLARQMLTYYQTQASIAAEGVPTSMRDDNAFRTALTLLENYDLSQKRHVQLRRTLVDLEFRADKNITLVKTPYATVGVWGDIANRIAFTHLILHQKPGRVPTATTPWSLDLRRTPEPYLLSYLESSRVNDGRAFAHMARQSRSAL